MVFVNLVALGFTIKKENKTLLLGYEYKINLSLLFYIDKLIYVSGPISTLQILGKVQ